MDPFTIATVGGLALSGLGAWIGHKGQRDTNEQNIALAREQMRFQERMSSTSVRRHVDDLRAAGLNPALAYGSQASSPGGASTMIGDPIAAGISSGMKAREHYDQIQSRALERRLLKAQGDATYAANQRDTAQAHRNAAEAKLLEQTFRFNNTMQPHQLRAAAADAQARVYGLPGLKNTADVEKALDKLGPGLSSAKTIAEIFKLLFKR